MLTFQSLLQVKLRNTGFLYTDMRVISSYLTLGKKSAESLPNVELESRVLQGEHSVCICK